MVVAPMVTGRLLLGRDGRPDKGQGSFHVGKSGHGREKGFEALYGFSVVKTISAYHG